MALTGMFGYPDILVLCGNDCDIVGVVQWRAFLGKYQGEREESSCLLVCYPNVCSGQGGADAEKQGISLLVRVCGRNPII